MSLVVQLFHVEIARVFFLAAEQRSLLALSAEHCLRCTAFSCPDALRDSRARMEEELQQLRTELDAMKLAAQRARHAATWRPAAPPGKKSPPPPTPPPPADCISFHPFPRGHMW